MTNNDGTSGFTQQTSSDDGGKSIVGKPSKLRIHNNIETYSDTGLPWLDRVRPGTEYLVARIGDC